MHNAGYRESEGHGRQCAYTPLIEYKTHQENARPLLLLNFYTELANDKGLVLMTGELDPDLSTVCTKAARVLDSLEV